MPSPARPRPKRFEKLYSGYDPRERAQQAKRLQQPPAVDVFLYDEGLAAAGFGFCLVERVLHPVLEIRPFDVADNYDGVEQAINAVVERHGRIGVVITPPVNAPPKMGYVQSALQQSIPDGYPFRNAARVPSFEECCEARATAIANGTLYEAGYSGAANLVEQLRQHKDGKNLPVALWAYLCGVYDLTINSGWTNPKIKNLIGTYSPPSPYRY